MGDVSMGGVDGVNSLFGKGQFLLHPHRNWHTVDTLDCCLVHLLPKSREFKKPMIFLEWVCHPALGSTKAFVCLICSHLPSSILVTLPPL